MNVKFEELKKNDTNHYKCDNCNGSFLLKDIILTEAVDNINIMTPMSLFVYINKEGNLQTTTIQASGEKSDKLLSCPLCKETHLFGFDMAK